MKQCQFCGAKTLEDCNEVDCGELQKKVEYVLYGYATPSGKLYASGMDALQAGEQSWVKVYVKTKRILNEERLRLY